MAPNEPTTAIQRVAIDQRLRGNDLRSQARLAWCLAGGGHDGDAKAAKDVGVSIGCIQVWRTAKEPDGQDWEQFRVQLSLGDHKAQIAMLATHDEVGVHAEIIMQAQRILGAVSAALNEGVLYDAPPPKKGTEDTRKVVPHLWDQEGKIVPVGPLRPKSASEAVRMLQGLSATLDGSYKRVEHLLAMRGDVQKVEDQVFSLCAQVVQELWGDAGAKKFWEAVIAKGASDDGGAGNKQAAPAVEARKPAVVAYDDEWEKPGGEDAEDADFEIEDDDDE